MEFHPLANIFPLIEGREFDELVADIAKHGLREPIWHYEGKILDGRNRYRALVELGIGPDKQFLRYYADDDPVAFVISMNLKRRHLDESQRAMVAAKLANLNEGRPSETAQICAVSQDSAAEMLNVSRRTVQSAAKIRDDGTPELVDAVERGKVSVSAAADVATLPIDRQREIVAAADPKVILDAAKEVRAERADKKRAERTVLLNELSNRNAPLPERKYTIIYADPPWEYDFSPSSDRSVENHYPTMPIENICAMPVEALATPDAMLFLWAPPSFIKKGIMVLEAWGFELAASAVWDKGKIGTGIYFRQQHEYLILGKRGQPITPRPGSQPASVIQAPRGKHSEKPEMVYEIIERMYPGLSRIELFSRSSREGWDAWGNQAQAA